MSQRSFLVHHGLVNHLLDLVLLSFWFLFNFFWLLFFRSLGLDFFVEVCIELFRLFLGLGLLDENALDVSTGASLFDSVFLLADGILLFEHIVHILSSDYNLGSLRIVAVLAIISDRNWNQSLVKARSQRFVVSKLLFEDIARRRDEVLHLLFNAERLPVLHPVVSNLINGL